VHGGVRQQAGNRRKGKYAEKLSRVQRIPSSEGDTGFSFGNMLKIPLAALKQQPAAFETNVPARLGTIGPAEALYLFKTDPDEKTLR